MGALTRWIFFCSLLPCFFSYSQETEIPWNPEFRLSWTDFLGKPQPNSKIAAVTASGISYSFTSVERDGYYEVDIEVTTFFYPLKSWYQPKLCDDSVLQHEQLHFDIAELFARGMREKIRNKRFTHRVKAEINAIYQQTLSDLQEFQNRYDLETNFSIDKKAQLKWNKKIKLALAQK